MDPESGIELGKVPLTQGEGSLPPPPVSTKNRRNPEDDDEYLVPIPPWTIKEIIVASLAGVTVFLSIISLLISINPFVTVMGIFGIVLPPFSAYQEQKITDCKAMKETNEAMERELNNLKFENERLAIENDKLEAAVDKIQESKDVLAECRRLNAQSITQLEEQLQESQEILQHMRENYRAEIIDNIFDVMLALDKDQDFNLSDEEIDTVTKKIESIEGLEIDDELFKQKIIETGRNLDAVMKLLNGLLDDDPNSFPEERKIITFISASDIVRNY